MKKMNTPNIRSKDIVYVIVIVVDVDVVVIIIIWLLRWSHLVT